MLYHFSDTHVTKEKNFFHQMHQIRSDGDDDKGKVHKKKEKKTNKNLFCPYTYLRPVETNFFPFFPICRPKMLVYSKYVGKKKKKNTNISIFSTTPTYLKQTFVCLFAKLSLPASKG